MKSATCLMKNTLFITGGSILLRLCALCFQAYLAGNIGAEQLGIFGIITSVGVVFATISISGVRFGVTRLVAQESSAGNDYPTHLMRCAFLYAAIFGFLSGVAMFFSASVLSVSYIGDVEAALPLRIMAVSMPAVAFSACIEGYFTAKQKVMRVVIMQTASQTLRILLSVAMLEIYIPRGAFPADILAFASTLGEIFFFLGMAILFGFEWGKGRKSYGRKNMSCLVKTALPLAVSAYMRTGLSSVGQVIIPSGLKKSGMESGRAFSSYGIITQMAMPVIMFPSALLSALGEVLIPRLTQAQAQGRKNGINYMANRALRIGAVFGFGIMGAMFFYSRDLGELIYKNSEAGFYIKIFAPIVPVIYIDCVTDGCLKGLGQQVYSMVLNVLEGIINVVLLYIFLPRAAIGAYIAVMYIKESFNTFFSLRRLDRIVKVHFDFAVAFTLCLCVVGAYLLCGIMGVENPVVKILVYVVLYITLLYLCNAVTREDIKWIISLFSNKKI